MFRYVVRTNAFPLLILFNYFLTSFFIILATPQQSPLELFNIFFMYQFFKVLHTCGICQDISIPVLNHLSLQHMLPSPFCCFTCTDIAVSILSYKSIYTFPHPPSHCAACIGFLICCLQCFILSYVSFSLSTLLNFFKYMPATMEL